MLKVWHFKQKKNTLKIFFNWKCPQIEQGIINLEETLAEKKIFKIPDFITLNTQCNLFGVFLFLLFQL